MSSVAQATCLTCGNTFDDIYPAGRCPFEYDHDTHEEEAAKPTSNIVVLQLDDEWTDAVVNYIANRYDGEVARVISIARGEEWSG